MVSFGETREFVHYLLQTDQDDTFELSLLSGRSEMVVEVMD